MLINFAGGIGLFLLGMRLMTDGLKVAAGEALREILAHWTASPLRGIFSGVLVTALVQSSSAVIFATIGFVNAGLLTLFQAVGVVLGSNLGTTVTSWLVALIGFKFDLKILSMPAIAVGMLLRATGSGTRRGALGEALAGFGLFFMGIEVLKEAFEGLAQEVRLDRWGGENLLGFLPFVGIGTLLTVAMQSSSAALAVTLTAAAGGVIPLQAAAALVIGANVGTTSTAAFAVIGATANAKRTALAHVLFNAVTALAAFCALPLLLGLISALGDALQLAPAPATFLAMFHTTTKVLGLLLFFPFTPALVRFLEGRFRTGEEDESQPRYLDKNVTATPALALDALVLELKRIGAIARRTVKSALSAEGPQGRRPEEDQRILDHLVVAVADFTSRVQQDDLPQDLSEAFPQALRVTQYYTDMVERTGGFISLQSGLTPLPAGDLATALSGFRAGAVRLLDATDPDAEGFAGRAYEESWQRCVQEYQQLKAALLRAGTEGRIPVRQMVLRLDEIGAIRRILDQAIKAARYLGELMKLEMRGSS